MWLQQSTTTVDITDDFTQLLEQKYDNVMVATFNTLRAGPRYIRTWISTEKTAVFGCLTNTLAPLPSALESCSRAQTDRPV